MTTIAPHERVFAADRSRLDSRGVSVFDVLAFTLPAVMFAEVTIVGRLFVTETILLSLLPFLLVRRASMAVSPLVTTLLAFGSLWLWAQVFTDVYRVTPFEDYSRGWFKIVFTLANFLAIYLLIENRPRRLALFAAGMAVGFAADYFVSPGVYAEGDPWKFGVAVPVTFGFALLACTARARRLPLASSAVMAAAGVLNLYYSFRSLAGVCLLTAAYLLLHRFVSRPRRGDVWFSARRLLLLTAVGIAAVVAIVEIYTTLAESGRLGRAAAAKAELQDGPGTFAVFMNGRPEISASRAAITQSPLIGHGSWAKDPELVAEYLAERERLGFRTSGITTTTGLIPSHSHLFGAWVEAGIVGALFWVWVLWLAVRVLSVTYRDAYPLLPLVAFSALLLVWDIFFSPFGAERRLIIPFYIVLMIYAWERVERARELHRPWRRAA